jgi:SAM-dependent methyltransferase
MKKEEAPPTLAESDIEYVRSRYLKRISEIGVTFQSMNSGTPEKQQIRHSIHASVIDENDAVLDVGSGIGQFYEHLLKIKYQGAYTGIDLIPDYVQHCSQKFPEARFYHTNFFDFKIRSLPDVIVASQVFNARYKSSDNILVLTRFLELAFSQTKSSVTVDMLTSYVDFTVPELFYFNPEQVFSIAKKFTRLVQLRHDYLPFEFTIQLYK